MWPNRGFTNLNVKPNEPNKTKSMTSVDSNQLLMAANSIRSLFGENLSQNLLKSIRDPIDNNMDRSAPQVRPYESEHFSRFDRNLLNQISPNISRNQSQFEETPQLRTTENRYFDPSKMPQKSILKKSKDQSIDMSLLSNQSFRSVEEEDNFLYGSSGSSLPPGIVQLEQRSAPPVERVLSPISLRLKREMENIEWSRRQSPPKEEWTQRLGYRPKDLKSDPINHNFNDEEENYQRKYRQHMNPSPVANKHYNEPTNDLENVRIQQLAALQALTQQQTQRRSLSPPKRLSRRLSPRRSPHSSPKRLRRSSRSRSPRRRSISPRYRRRSRSPSRERRRRSRSRSNSRDRSRRRSLTPERRNRTASVGETRMTAIKELNPQLMHTIPQIIPMGAQGFDMSFMAHQQIVSPQVFYPQLIPPFAANIRQQLIPQQQTPPKPVIRGKSALRNIPLVKNSAQPIKKPVIQKKEDKLINAKDLLIAERSKIREELNVLKKQLEKKIEEQAVIVAKDGGTNSYAYRTLDKIVTNLKDTIAERTNQLDKNEKLINEIGKSKTKQKQFVAKVKTTGNLPKDIPIPKKKEIPKSTGSSPKKLPVSTSVEKKPENKPKEEKKEVIDDEEEEEKNSRFHYFDSGPHWCKTCDKFSNDMKQYFNHIHTKEHLNKVKESERTPWVTKDYIKQIEKTVQKNKEQLVVASKGIQFIHPTQGFYCDLCKQFLNDIYLAEKHFRTAKHNRSYTRYTLLHNNYESKWKSERDKAYTELKKKERELEKAKAEENRRKLEEEVKRKDKEVKEKIEAMNKNLKTVSELVEPKETNVDKNKAQKSIRLNLSSNKNEKSDKSSENETKNKQKEKERHKEKTEMHSKTDGSDSKPMEMPIEGMQCIIIDEINCDSQEKMEENEEKVDDNDMDEEVIEEIIELVDDSTKVDDNSGQKSAQNELNSTNLEILNKKYEEMDTNAEHSADSNVQGVQPSDTESAINAENNDLNSNDKEVEGVMPEVEPEIEDKGNTTVANDNHSNGLVGNLETGLKSNESLDQNVSKIDKNSQQIENEKKVNLEIEDNTKAKEDKSMGVANKEAKEDSQTHLVKTVDITSTEVISKVSEIESEPKNVKHVDKASVLPNTDKASGSQGVDIKTGNTKRLSNIVDLDLGLEELHQRFADISKKDKIQTESDGEADELEGFDVIDSVNEDNNDLVELSE